LLLELPLSFHRLALPVKSDGRIKVFLAPSRHD
jgi:hypothetical protein